MTRAEDGAPRLPGRPGRTGRRGGDSGTREAILAAARRRFGDHGYDGATIRAIAADAGVDAALVHHFFGNKERLFSAAMRLPLVPGEIVAAALAPEGREPGRTLGEHLLRTMRSAWDVPDIRSTFLGLLRSAMTSEQAAALMREFVTEAILGRIADAVRAAEPAAAQPGGAAAGPPELRAALVASQVLGLALTRYVLEIGPVATADPADLAAAIGPALDRYLSGDLGGHGP